MATLSIMSYLTKLHLNTLTSIWHLKSRNWSRFGDVMACLMIYSAVGWFSWHYIVPHHTVETAKYEPRVTSAGTEAQTSEFM